MKSIVSAQWLNSHFLNPNLIILDASVAKSKSGLTVKNPGIQIKGARKFDFKNDFSDKKSAFPNMLPSPEEFEKGCRNIGICNKSILVVYDNRGIYSSPRVWWMFKTMRFDNIAVLDGGLDAWVSLGFPIEKLKSENAKKPQGNFTANFRSYLVVNKDFVRQNIETQTHLLIDARSSGRFLGTQLEPRAGLPGGNIPNSVNLPYTEVLKEGKFKSKPELNKLFSKFKIGDKPLIFSCGSGITACIIMLAAEQILDNPKAVYDGSWTQWALTEKP